MNEESALGTLALMSNEQQDQSQFRKLTPARRFCSLLATSPRHVV